MKLLSVFALGLLLATAADAQLLECVDLMNQTGQIASTNGNARSVQGYTFGARLIATNTVGTTPTLDVHLEHSPDCSNWVDLTGGAFTQVTTGGPNVQDLQFLGSTVYVYGCVRAVTVIGGTATPTYNVQVQMCSDGM